MGVGDRMFPTFQDLMKKSEGTSISLNPTLCKSVKIFLLQLFFPVYTNVIGLWFKVNNQWSKYPSVVGTTVVVPVVVVKDWRLDVDTFTLELGNRSPTGDCRLTNLIQTDPELSHQRRNTGLRMKMFSGVIFHRSTTRGET